MAQYYNVVANPNGTFTIEDYEQLCTLDGQVVVVEDNTGTNVITRPIIAYTTSDNTEQTVFSQQTINLATQVSTSQLEPRQNVYIIKANDSNEPTIFSKVDTGNNRGSREQVNICYAPAQANWIQTSDNNETYEIVIKKDPSPVKSIAANIVKSPQHILTAQTSAPNVVVQGGPDKKPTRLVPLAKRHSLGNQAVQIVKTPLRGGASCQGGRGGKMRRTSSVGGNTNVTLTAAASPRATTAGANIQQLVSPPRGPQARPPIHADAAQKNCLPASRNAVPTQSSDMNALSERIKQQQTSSRQSKAPSNQVQRQQQQQPAALAAAQAQRSAQAAQAGQRQRAMGNLFNRPQQTQLQQEQILQQQVQQQQQQLQQQHALRQAQQQILAQQQMQAVAMAETGETPMDVDCSDNAVPSDRLCQVNCTAKSDPEDSSSESYAYLQQEIEDPVNAIVQQQITGNEAKMLVILENGEQRLITFEVPKEDCSVQDLLEQASIQASQEPRVSLVNDPALGINYIVEITPKSAPEEDQYTDSNDASNVTSTVESRSPLKNNNTNSATAPATSGPRVPKYVKGMLAVCSSCGMSAADFNFCMRCKRKLPENVKAVPVSTNTSAKKECAVPPNTFYKKGEAPKLDREAVARRGRGRGRGMARVTRQNKEPECLTISSDEEDENRKPKRPTETKEATNPQSTTNSEEVDTILEKEPIITNSTVTVNQTTSSGQHSSGETDKSSLMEPANNLSTHLTCRTVRIGSYKYVPNNEIQIGSSGLKLEVPCLEDDKSFITVEIKYTDLVKVLIHFSKSMPVLFFYTNVKTGLRIRDLLGMQDPKGPYFDPAGKDHTHKRITLLPEKVSEESKLILKELYKKIFEELNAKEANDILVKASPKTNQVQTPIKRQASTSSTNNSNSNGIIQTITVYPAPPAKGGIAINTEDFICLAEDQFLNDVIIDFYLKYLTLEVLSEADSKRTHVFSSYFYKRLTSPHTQAVENVENLSAAGKRHARVQKWTKNVNIFEKDFVVIPINEHAHWFLAIICFPGLVGKVAPKVETKPDDQKTLEKKKKDSKVKSLTIGNTTITPVSTITIDTNDDGSERDEAEGDDEEMETDSDEEDEEAKAKTDAEQTDTETTSAEPVNDKPHCQTPENKEITKVPCILIFDSLAGASRARVVATLRDYLSCEYQAKMGAEQVFTKDTIKGACPKVPQQSNFTDCGLYVLQYVESFFQNPVTDYTLPIKTLKTWFEEIVVTRKREELAKLLTTLVNKTKGNKTINLPTLVFPTQDGKLKQKPEPPVEAKATKAEAEKKKAVAEPSEGKANATVTSTNNGDNTNETTAQPAAAEQAIPSTPPQPSSTTDANKEALASSPKTPRNNSDTMAFLKNKRIPRLQKPSDNQEDKQVAKKHKGESFDSCK